MNGEIFGRSNSLGEGRGPAEERLIALLWCPGNEYGGGGVRARAYESNCELHNEDFKLDLSAMGPTDRNAETTGGDWAGERGHSHTASSLRSLCHNRNRTWSGGRDEFGNKLPSFGSWATDGENRRRTGETRSAQMLERGTRERGVRQMMVCWETCTSDDQNILRQHNKFVVGTPNRHKGKQQPGQTASSHTHRCTQ